MEVVESCGRARSPQAPPQTTANGGRRLRRRCCRREWRRRRRKRRAGNESPLSLALPSSPPFFPSPLLRAPAKWGEEKGGRDLWKRGTTRAEAGTEEHHGYGEEEEEENEGSEEAK